MALTLTLGETQVRQKTQHLSVNDPRATSTVIKAALNQAYKQLRLELRLLVPELYLCFSDPVVVPAGDDIDLMSSPCGDFDALHRVEHLGCDGKWYPVERADTETYREHQLGGITFRRESNCLIFSDHCGPLTTEQTFRLVYYVVPVDLTAPNDLFLIPAALELPLVLRASADILLNDGDGATRWLEYYGLAQKLLDAAVPALKKQYGTHKESFGSASVRQLAGDRESPLVFDFSSNPRPRDYLEVWDRLVRLVLSLSDSKVLPSVALVTGAAGNLVPHLQTTRPKSATAQVVGNTASTAQVTVGAIGPVFLTVYTTADCTADITLRL